MLPINLQMRFAGCGARQIKPFVAENDEISLVIRRTSSVPGPGSLSSEYAIASRKLFDLMSPGSVPRISEGPNVHFWPSAEKELSLFSSRAC